MFITVIYIRIFICMYVYRMFITTMELKPNESGDYEVAKGVSATIFRAILVSEYMVLF